MRLKVLFVCLFFVVTLLASFPGLAQSSSPQDTLNQYISDLQKNPDDIALREKIIKLAQEMKPSPKVPDEVDELIGKATYIFKNAKSEAEFNDAVDAYQKALLIAPWVPEYYYNLGAVQEKAGKLKEAVGSLELYLLAAPDAKDAKEVREHIGGLKYAAEKAAKESSPAAVAAEEQKKSEDWLKKLDGRRYTLQVPDPEGDVTAVIDIRSTVAIVGIIYGQNYQNASYRGYKENRRFEIRGRETTLPVEGGMQKWWKEDTFVISEDGEKITVRRLAHDGERRESDYLLER